ncbi:MAG: hypothetical protein C0391_04255 [Anaerolinea sp.]|nr:hypothetical protein [Anaerolinea sp.]
MDTSNLFFLGRKVDPTTGKASSENVYYDPADMTTHGVVTGMTGSGKTGLCIGLLEEAALQHIPAIIIDPKGDLTNLVLHFPDQKPLDFQPWVDPDVARKSGKTIETLAAETAKSWSDGLASWGIDSARIKALAESVKFCIYTPGSDSGIPVSILSSLKAPESGTASSEVVMEKISSTVSALLGLVGLTDIDPVRSREHILLTNIFQHAWSQGQDLDLSELILQTQTPPFEKLGVFPLNKFYPQKERDDLAILLNNFLASPAFQIWMSGEGLDIRNMLYASDGSPRHSIFYIAHLSETERMFFVTLLYSSIEAWMRQQTGTTGLRALVYFDEILGYLPPLQNPPSKQVILRMLKQARAFGIGLLLATQNPVDVDYKALSNAGTWFIGKLQTDQDKQRLLDGLEGVAGGMDRSKFDRLISSLGKRIFLLHNVHESAPVIMQSRWAMNYLAGPLTRVQIPALNKLVGAAPQSTKKASAPAIVSSATAVSGESAPAPGSFTTTRPSVPQGIDEYFMPNNLTLSESASAGQSPLPAGKVESRLYYQPALIGQSSIRYLDRRYQLDQVVQKAVLVTQPDKRGMVRWEDHLAQALETRLLNARLDPQAVYASLDHPLTDVKMMTSLKKDYSDWVFQSGELRLLSNTALKLYASPPTSEAEFKLQCSKAAESSRKAEMDRLAETQKKRTSALRDKLAREERELSMDKSELNSRSLEEAGAGLDTVLGLFGGRKRSISKNLTKRRMTASARANVEESARTIEALQKQIADIERSFADEQRVIIDKWDEVAGEITSMPVIPTKANIFLEVFGVIWLPYYQVNSGGETLNLPGYKI